MDGALHVLVVDDDPDTALFVRTVLQRGGMAVTTVADPLEAELAVVRYLEDVFLAPSDVVAEEAAR